MASAKAQEENRVKAISLGANAYFQKPLTLSKLIPAVQQLIDESQANGNPETAIVPSVG